MIKILLVVVVVLASAGLGNVISQNVFQRRKVLLSFIQGAKCMKNAMVYEQQPLQHALFHCGGNEFFMRCAKISGKYPELLGGDLVKRALAEEKGNESTAVLKEEEKRELAAFVHGLSVAMLPEHIEEVCGRFLGEYGRALREVNAVQLKRAKLIKSMCVLSGLALGIILI